MTEFKGTPGKWGFTHSSVSDSSTACIEITSTESLHEVAYLQSTPSNIGKHEQTSFDKTISNAHLIAAAPELLEALLELVGSYDDFRTRKRKPESPQANEIIKARAAIAKALGKE